MSGHAPVGRDEVTSALKAAAAELLASQGTHFSVRDVARLAGVNHGLVHRHFGSKHELIHATLIDLAVDLELRLRDGASPLDLVATERSPTAAILARLILDRQTDLMTEHPAVQAIVDQARAAQLDGTLSPEARAALATAIALGWSVFGEYALAAAGAGADDRTGGKLAAIIDDLIGSTADTGSHDQTGGTLR